MAKDWNKVAGRLWPFLVATAKRKTTISYGAIAPCGGEGVTARTVGYGLSPIQEYCIEKKLPPLTVLVVNKNLGRPGAGFKKRGSLYQAFQKVYGHPWDSTNPFGNDIETDPKEILRKTDPYLADILERSGIARDDPAYAEFARSGLARGDIQSKFRNCMLELYGHKCAVCEFDKVKALEAAHIVRWADDERARGKLQNGILLCANHHKLFDNGIFYIDEKYKICGGIIEETGRKIVLPKNEKNWPSKKFLRRHKERIDENK